MKTLVTSDVSKALKIKEKSKGKTKDNRDLDAKSENFNLENLDINV